MANIDYGHFRHHPDLIALCMECEKNDCDGLCDRYRIEFRRVAGLPPIRRYLDPYKGKAQKGPNGRPSTYSHTIMYKGELTANGETHTLKEWAEISGISQKALYMRMHRGMTIEEALKKGVCARTPPKMLTAFGETKTIREWAEISGQTKNSIRMRLMRGLSPEEAVARPKRGYEKSEV